MLAIGPLHFGARLRTQNEPHDGGQLGFRYAWADSRRNQVRDDEDACAA